MNFVDIKNIHFVGIGGIGMSGLAEILAGAGVTVSGCDLKRSPATELLSGRGVDVRIGHDPAHLTADTELVVITEAELTHERLAAAITEILNDPERALRMGKATRSLATPDASKSIVDLIDRIQRT